MDVPKLPLLVLFALLLIFVVGVGKGARSDRQESKRASGGEQVDPENLQLPDWFAGLSARATSLFGGVEALDPSRIEWLVDVRNQQFTLSDETTGPRRIATFTAQDDADFQSLAIVPLTRDAQLGFESPEQTRDFTHRDRDEPLTLMVSPQGGTLWLDKKSTSAVSFRIE